MLLLKLGNIIDYLIIKHWSIWLWSVDRWLLVSRRNWDNIKCIPWMQAAGVLQVYRVARLFSPHSPKTWQMFVQKSTVKFNYISDSTPVEWSICLETGVIIPGSIFVSSHMQRRSPTFFLHHGLVRTRTWFSPMGNHQTVNYRKMKWLIAALVRCMPGYLVACILSACENAFHVVILSTTSLGCYLEKWLSRIVVLAVFEDLPCTTASFTPHHFSASNIGQPSCQNSFIFETYQVTTVHQQHIWSLFSYFYFLLMSTSKQEEIKKRWTLIGGCH